jgi:hypothetical protein
MADGNRSGRADVQRLGEIGVPLQVALLGIHQRGAVEPSQGRGLPFALCCAAQQVISAAPGAAPQAIPC